MLKKILLLCFVLLGYSAIAQQERQTINGHIFVPEGDDPQGITIYNESSNSGTITNRNGEFSLAVGLNDKLSFSALQFENFTLSVEQSVLDTKNLKVYINAEVTDLPEVVISETDLSGNVRVDVARLEKDLVDLPRYNAAKILASEVVLPPDAQSSPSENVAMNNKAWLTNGLNIKNIVLAVLGNDVKDNPFDKENDPRELDDNVRRIYSSEFFKKQLGIEEKNINDFIFYAADHGLNGGMLQKGNELDFISFLITQSQNYKKQKTENK